MFTRIGEALQHIFSALGDLSLADWGLIVGIMLAPVAIVSALFAGWPLWQQWRKQQLLGAQFGAEFFDAATIERSTRYYVEPHCVDIDPTQEAELRRTYPVRERLFEAIDRFLSEETPHKHCIVLADSGMGKSSFVLNYYARNQKRTRSTRHRLAVVPLGSRQALDSITTIEHPQETVLFLDAFDEDTAAIADHEQRLYDLMGACERFKRVLLTCRTQFFPSAQEIPEETGLVHVGPRGQGEPGGHIFWKLYLAPLDDDEVRAFLRQRYRWDRRMRQRAHDAVRTIPLLSVRPMLLAYIPDVLSSQQRITRAYDLYEVMIEQWIEREQPWVEASVLRAFSEQLAVKLFAERQVRGSERMAHAELQGLPSQWDIRLEDWQLRGRSLLNRDAEGNYKFAHRSIMEFLALKRFLQGEKPAHKLPLTDQMNAFLHDRLVSTTDLQYSYLVGAELSGARLHGAHLEGADCEGANLQGADLEDAHLKHANLVRAHMQDANLKGADLQEALLPWDGLQNAIYDRRTRWPDGLDHLTPGGYAWETKMPTAWTNSLGMVFVQIPAGTFLTGSPESARAVWLPQPFYLGKYPVTQGQWEAVMGSNPSQFTGDPDRPVEGVSWEEVQGFLMALNTREQGTSYRLPTEAQWEYAARAGSTGAYFFGHDERQLRDYAWYQDNSVGQTHAVGQKPANPWGLHDMYGNVWEWVEDWYGPYTHDAQVHPSGPESGSYRVVRGGSGRSVAEFCRSSIRFHYDPGYRDNVLGFRLARLGPLAFFSWTFGGEPVEPQAALRDALRDGSPGPAMVWLPGGVFIMGADRHGDAREKPTHAVEVRACSIGQYPVTCEEYETFCAATGREPLGGASWKRSTRPVTEVSWEDAAAYCAWLSEQTGMAYRLPTEAEWEYACRAGSDTDYCYGDDDAQLGDYAWYRGNAGGMPHPVGEKHPNSWQLYDMHGNVWEWVGDWYGAYTHNAQVNPSGLESGSDRVVRGGCWYLDAVSCRSSIRSRYDPGNSGDYLGFRLARDGAWPSYPFTLGRTQEDQSPGRIAGAQRARSPVFSPFQVFQDPCEDGALAPELVYIPGGTFTMGDLQENGSPDERPVREVTLGAFAIGRYPLTVAEYMRFVDSTRSHQPAWLETGSASHREPGRDERSRQAGVRVASPAHPVVRISWNDAAAYCAWLSQQTGAQYRLLTEAQWEYACRAGSSTEYCFGSDTAQLGDYAWYAANAGDQLHLVGQKQPNAWGLYDMHGNVWEWIGDWYGAYSAEPQYNPGGLESGSGRVIRGGVWDYGAENCRSSIRGRNAPGNRGSVLGVRLARLV